MAVARVGISGWTYAPWRGTFYPKGLVHRDELAFAAARLDSIEINGSFYSLQRPSSYKRWAEETRDDFVFAVKGGRYITHILRLRNTRGALANFFASGVLALGPKLGPLLWQLPPTLQFDEEAVAAFLASLPRTTAEAAELAAESTLDKDRKFLEAGDDRRLRHAVEVRHPSFDNDAFVKFARDQGVAIVVADTAGRYPVIREATTDFMYVRLHGDEELYTSGYTPEALDSWAEDMRGWLDEGLDVYAYFDNDVKVRSPYDAMALRERLA
ncbi:MAG TPA: DUF72 domain-containing protein [Leifsonia sp.]|nr:DUF72 domain-containing protein [Leifsonia sp.]